MLLVLVNKGVQTVEDYSEFIAQRQSITVIPCVEPCSEHLMCSYNVLDELHLRK